MTERIEQVKIYLGKHARLFKTEKGYKTIVFAAIVAYLASYVLQTLMFKEDIDTKLGFFTLISAAIWIGIFNSIQNICKERPIIKREHRSGLHMSSYVVSHMVFQAGICFIEAIIFLTVSQMFIKYPTATSLLSDVYSEYFITFFLVIYAADVLALAISSIVKNPTSAMTLMPFVLIFQLLFAGVLFKLDGPLNTLANGTISKWGLQASAISCNFNTLEKLEVQETRLVIRKVARSYDFEITNDQLDFIMEEAYKNIDTYNPIYEYSLSNLLTQWRNLIIEIFVFGAIAIGSLEFIDNDKR